MTGRKTQRQPQRQPKEQWKNFYSEHKICVLVFLLLFVIWFVIAVYMKYAPFGSNSMLLNDATHQYYPLFSQYRDRILSGKGILYSTGGGLGFNFYALWTYYLSSPLNLLVVLFPAAEVDSAMNILIMFKIILSGTAFAYYLEKRYGKNLYTIIPFACGYALSTFVLGYSYNIMWMDCLALFPIILAGFEALLKEGKWKLYTVSLASCLWCSFYIGFMVCLFLILWFLLSEHPSVKAFFKKGMQFAACSILGAGMACIVLVPAYLGIVQTQSASVFPSFDWMGEFVEIFAGKEGGVFAFSDPMSLNNEQAYHANLYCGVFVMGLTALYFMAKDIRLLTKIKAAWLIVLFLLSFNNQALNYIWHGFHYQVGIPNRFAFLLLFFLLLISYEAFQRLPEYKIWQILLAGITSMAVYGGLYLLRQENVTVQMLLCSISFAAVYMLLWIFYRQEGQQGRFWRNILLMLMTLELSANAIAGSRMQAGVAEDTFYREKSGLIKMAGTLLEEPYRTELSNPTVKNEGMAYDLKGTGIFSSTTNIRTIGLLHDIGFSTSSNAYIIAGSTPVLNTLFGIKNYLILNGDSNRLDQEYEEKEVIGNVTRYEKEQVLPVAYLCEDSVQDWSSIQSDFFENQMELLKLMTGKEYQVFTEQEYTLAETNDIEVSELDGHQQFTYLSAKGNRNNHVVFEAKIEKDEDLYLRIQAAYANKVAVLVNDEAIAYKDLKSSFYHVGQVKKGDTVQIMMGIQENSPTFGSISMSMYAYDADVMEEAYKDLAMGGMDIKEWKEGDIQGTVTVEGERKILFTTIPYDKGWKLFVDGKEKAVQTIRGGFLMVELDEGQHSVEFKYQVPGLWQGAVGTMASVLIFAVIVWWTFKKRSKKEATGELTYGNETEEEIL